jgi:hypothetical protein
MDTAVIRCKHRLVVTMAALIFGPLLMGGPAVLGLVFVGFALFGKDFPSALLWVAGALLMFAVSGFIAYHMLQNYHWVELDGASIRGRRFWSRRLVEHRLEDITEIQPLQALAKHHTINVLIDGITGTSNRGYEIHFRSGPSLAVVRGDMPGVDGFIEAVRHRRLEASAD